MQCEWTNREKILLELQRIVLNMLKTKLLSGTVFLWWTAFSGNIYARKVFILNFMMMPPPPKTFRCINSKFAYQFRKTNSIMHEPRQMYTQTFSNNINNKRISLHQVEQKFIENIQALSTLCVMMMYGYVCVYRLKRLWFVCCNAILIEIAWLLIFNVLMIGHYLHLKYF